MTVAMQNDARRRRQAGFLLTETLAAFTISAFVLLGLVTASSVLLRAVDRSVAHAQNIEELNRTVASIVRDVSNLARARWNGYEPRSFVFHGGPSSLIFVRTQQNSQGVDETKVIALREIVDGERRSLVRREARLSAFAGNFGDLRFGAQSELGLSTARIRFSYVVPPGGENAGRDLREWRTDTVLPAAIIVEAVDRETGTLVLSTQVSIRANADIGCLAGDQANPSPQAQLPPPSGDLATRRGFCGRLGENGAENDTRDAVPPTGPAMEPVL